jgi:hypothetical protein
MEHKKAPPAAPPKTKGPRPHPRRHRADAKEGPLAEHEVLYAAVGDFLEDNSSFGSTAAIDAALADLGACTGYQAAFAVPVQHKLFPFDGALAWLFFLRNAPPRAVKEGDAPFSPGAPFDLGQALDLLAQVYDISADELVGRYFGERDAEAPEDAEAPHE